MSEIFVQEGFSYLRFGQIVIDEVNKRKLEINEANERLVREELRKEHGMAVMAKLNIPKISRLLKTSNVVADGLYSFEEYKLLKQKFKDSLIVIAVYAPPEIRYKRLETRTTNRSIKRSDAISRDYAEIENLNKGGPIAMADATILNTGSRAQLKAQVRKIIDKLQKQ